LDGTAIDKFAKYFKNTRFTWKKTENSTTLLFGKEKSAIKHDTLCLFQSCPAAFAG
jgi:hypothetical protein